MAYLADQSFMRTMPKMCSPAFWAVMESPRAGQEPPTKKAISSSKSMRRQGPNLGGSVSTGRVCPFGRRTGVPEITTEEARPWYPTGRYFQLGIRAFSLLRNMVPTFLAWSREE